MADGLSILITCMYIQKIGAETVVARGVLYGCVLYVHTKIGAEKSEIEKR